MRYVRLIMLWLPSQENVYNNPTEVINDSRQKIGVYGFFMSTLGLTDADSGSERIIN